MSGRSNTNGNKDIARQAGLRYTSDEGPEIYRKRRRYAAFAYVDERGKPVRDRRTLERIKSLVIPPAWTDVWIAPCSNGHLQATGRDARRRKQYRYHPAWTAAQDQNKYERVISFARALPRIRRRASRDLRRHGLPRETVLAAIVQLLEQSLIRVGNDGYARANGSYGLTTMRDKHVRIQGSEIR
jgi:DNA topoisomerase-1